MDPTAALKSLVKSFPVIKDLVAERDALVKANGIVSPDIFTRRFRRWWNWPATRRRSLEKCRAPFPELK